MQAFWFWKTNKNLLTFYIYIVIVFIVKIKIILTASKGAQNLKIMKKIYQDIPFGVRNGEPNAVPAELVIGHGKLADYVLNLFQSSHGMAVMSIPRDGRPLIDWSQEERLAFFDEAVSVFGKLWLHLPRTRSELLLNQGELVGQTIPHPHLHCFCGGQDFILNWGKVGIPSTISPVPFTGELPLTGQYNLYHNFHGEAEGGWLLIDRGSSPRKEDNPRREGVFPIIVDGTLLPEWERKRNFLRGLFLDFFG